MALSKKVLVTGATGHVGSSTYLVLAAHRGNTMCTPWIGSANFLPACRLGTKA